MDDIPGMNRTFDRLYDQLGRATAGLLIATTACYAITLLCALLGLTQEVVSLRGATLSLVYAFAVCLGLFLLTSVSAALIRRIDGRSQH